MLMHLGGWSSLVDGVALCARQRRARRALDRQDALDRRCSADSAPMRSMTATEEDAVRRALLASGTPLYDLPQTASGERLYTLKEATTALEQAIQELSLLADEVQA
jgi:hypothetical protein